MNTTEVVWSGTLNTPRTQRARLLCHTAFAEGESSEVWRLETSSDGCWYTLPFGEMDKTEQQSLLRLIGQVLRVLRMASSVRD